ncbi:MAG TPA: ATP synthase F1 subunit epsilon [Alphaproteobacteria bacterium]|nr:ATP synthase F1 subunit epsilon [Alphaproteobacteria bacterium]HNS44054.1 ATP synthase F1 subunit epsilon [Alphaproteobacteria bacterium]
MATMFNFELVSPERKVISEEAFQVTIPGEEGMVGVRAGHMALVVSVRPGVVEVIRKEGGEVERIFIAGGFADISAEHCTVLAEEAVPVYALNAEKLEAELARLNEELGFADTADEKAKLSRRVAIVTAMMDAVR